MLQHYRLLQRHACIVPSSFKTLWIGAVGTYRCCEFGRLSGLPALLTNWRERRAHSRNVVGGEAAVQLAAHIVGGAHLSTGRVAERERVFARGAEAPVACRIGHFELEIHWRPAVSANLRRISHVCGVRAVRRRARQELCRSQLLQGLV